MGSSKDNESWSPQDFQQFFKKVDPPKRRGKRNTHSGPSANHLTNMVLNFLRAQADTDCWRQNNTAVFDGKRYRKFRGREGISDIIGIYTLTGAWIAVEIKSEGDRESTKQKVFREMLTNAGAFAMVVQSNEGFDRLTRDFPKWVAKQRRISQLCEKDKKD